MHLESILKVNSISRLLSTCKVIKSKFSIASWVARFWINGVRIIKGRVHCTSTGTMVVQVIKHCYMYMYMYYYIQHNTCNWTCTRTYLWFIGQARCQITNQKFTHFTFDNILYLLGLKREMWDKIINNHFTIKYTV